jgi:hypothetical protein
LDELGLLAAALCEGEITPSQAVRLEELARQSSESRRFLLRYLQLHGELYWETAASAGREAEAGPHPALRGPAPLVRQPKTGEAERLATKPAMAPPRWMIATAVAASLLVAGLLGVVSYYSRPRPSQESSGPVAVAQLTRTFQAAWSDAIDLSERSSLVSNQQLELRSGLAEIRFDGGARVILQGPASFRVGGGSRGHLLLGTLTADLSEQAAELTLDTPNATIVHQGTQFGVAVANDGTTEVHVFHGAVAVRARGESAPGATRHKATRAQAVRVAACALDGRPQIREIEVDSNRFVRQFPAPGRVAGFRALVAEHRELLHHYTFEGVTEREILQDKRGGLDLVEVVMYEGAGNGNFGYFCPGVDATTNAVRPYRGPARGNAAGVGLQSEANAAAETEAWFVPPEAFTIELLVSFDGFAHAADGQVAAAVATRRGERECGFFLAAVDRGRLVHLMDADAPWVCSQLECAPGEWYYVASTFRVGPGKTTVNTYAANVSRGETALRRVVEGQVAVGEPAAGPLGIGKGFAANLAHAYPWSGTLDEVAIYSGTLGREALEKHLQALVGRRQ